MTTEQDKIELSIIGTLIIDEVALNSDITQTISPSMFSNTSIREVFESIQSIQSSGKHPDLIQVTADLNRRKRLEYVGGVGFVSGLTAHRRSIDLFRDSVLLLHEQHFRRRLAAIGSEILSLSAEPSVDVFNAISRSVVMVDELNSITDIRKEKPKAEILQEAVTEIESRSKTGVAGVPCGIHEVDESIGGFERGGVTIIAGRPGSGKTAFAVSMVNKMISSNAMNGAFFSLEMSAKSLYQRFIAMAGDVRSSHIWRGNLSSDEWSKVGRSVDALNAASVEVFDKYFSLSEIVAKTRSMHLKKPLDFVVIDYLQLISLDTRSKGNREQEVSMISRTLKMMAMQLDIPVIALSQLSRAVEQRGGDKKPMLSDLRESGSLEQDASTVLFTYRPSYYGFLGESGESLEDKAYLIMGKHRNGSLKDIELHYKHDHNQEWASYKNSVFSESFVVDEYPRNNFKQNEEF